MYRYIQSLLKNDIKQMVFIRLDDCILESYREESKTKGPCLRFSTAHNICFERNNGRNCDC